MRLIIDRANNSTELPLSAVFVWPVYFCYMAIFPSGSCMGQATDGWQGASEISSARHSGPLGLDIKLVFGGRHGINPIGVMA